MIAEPDTIEVGGCLFPTSPITSEQDNNARAKFKTCAKREQKLFKRLQSATPESKLFNEYVDQYLHSPAVRFFAIIAQAKRLKPLNRLPLSEYLKLANQFSPYQPIDEIVEFWFQAKPNGVGCRELHDFGPKYRAAQYMVKRVISVIFAPKSFQYSIAKRGSNKAVEAIMKEMRDGYNQTLTLDISDYFGSFNLTGLTAALPLPEAVIKNIIMPDKINFKMKEGETKTKKQNENSINHYYYDDDNNYVPCPPLLSQGSLCSNIVAEYIVSRLNMKMPKGIKLFVYVDDICILARDVKKLEMAKCALLTAFGQSAAGNFKFNALKEKLQSNMVAFLGYQIYLPIHSNIARARPNEKNTAKYDKKCIQMERRLRRLKKQGKPVEEIQTELVRYMRYRVSWLAAFYLAYDFTELRAHAFKRVATICFQVGVNVETVQNLTGQFFKYAVSKTPKNKGGYTYTVKITEIAKVLEPEL